jgi:hypothetical protein
MQCRGYLLMQYVCLFCLDLPCWSIHRTANCCLCSSDHDVSCISSLLQYIHSHID